MFKPCLQLISASFDFQCFHYFQTSPTHKPRPATNAICFVASALLLLRSPTSRMYRPSDTISNPEVVKAGYLTKSPPGDAPPMSQWRRRWFVLCDSFRAYPLAERHVRLEYFQNEAEARKLCDPKGVLVIIVLFPFPLVQSSRTTWHSNVFIRGI